jgi:predicted CopG family antitoxin
MRNIKILKEKLLNYKAEQNNSIDLDVYALGLNDMGNGLSEIISETLTRKERIYEMINGYFEDKQNTVTSLVCEKKLLEVNAQIKLLRYLLTKD